MFINMMPWNPYMNNMRQKSYIRVLHAVPDAPAVDVYANGQLIAPNLMYREFTDYLTVPSGNYKIEIYPAGTRDEALVTTTATLPRCSIFTVAAVGQLADISLLPIPEPIEPINPNMPKVRFTHLSPTAPNVDIILSDGTVLFSDVRFKETTEYIMAPTGVYNFKVRIAGTDQEVLQVPNVQLKPNRFYTVYAVGLLGKEPPLQVLIPLDGNSYIMP